LKRAEGHATNNKKLKAATYNNFACFFGRTKKIRTALTYLEKALSLEKYILSHIPTHEEFQKVISSNSPADIYLNICVTYSQLGKHDNALLYGRSALLLMQGEVIDILKSGDKSKKDSRLVVLIISLHNIAVEYEHIRHVIG
jgi:tetratricopeptide (TPR) repeat protein